MKYKRQEIFTLSKILDQLVEYVREKHRLPKSILLPPEEYVYINYLFSDLEKQVTHFVGIKLGVNYEKQTIQFQY